jgi:uncharacterized DUF497 family protein
MHKIRFEWDERKASQNARKHGVPFEEALTVFFGRSISILTLRRTRIVS